MINEMTTAPVDLDAPTSSGDRCNPFTQEQETTMMAHPSDSTPDAFLPVGAVPPDDVVRGWADYDNEFRIIYGTKHVLRSEVQPEGELWVEACAVQMADGTIQSRNLAAIESGPTVSVQCHWENYLTSDEARTLARFIEQSADLVEKWSSYERHACGFDWCTSRWNDAEHFACTYYDATLRHGDPYHLRPGNTPLRIGVGLVYTEGEIPAVIIHLDGGQYDYDHDAHLKLSEAVAIRDALTEVIEQDREAMVHWVDHLMGSAQ